MRVPGFLLLSMLFPAAADAAGGTKRPTDLERGEELYERHCLACHGAKNAGDGPATEALVHPVPNLAGKTDPKSAEQQQVVLAGRNAMPAYEGSFNVGDAHRVLLYMATVHVPKEEPGRATYEAKCVSCHGATGEGDGAAAATLPNPPRDLSDAAFWIEFSDAQVKEAITEGKEGSIMRGFPMPAEQLDALLAYLKAFQDG